MPIGEQKLECYWLAFVVHSSDIYNISENVIFLNVAAQSRNNPRFLNLLSHVFQFVVADFESDTK